MASGGLRLCAALAAGAVAFAAWRRYRAARRARAAPAPALDPGEGAGVGGAFCRRVLWPDSLRAEGAQLLEEQLSRGCAFVGAPAHAALCDSLIVVVGLASGVGGHAAHLLARGGVRRLRLVGASRVSRASLAVEAVALRSDVGRPCGAVLRARLLRIVPDCGIDVLCADWRADEGGASPASAGGARAHELARAERVLAPAADGAAVSLVLDCLEGAAEKAALLAACAARGVRVISVGRVRGRGDLTRWHVSASLSDAAIADPCLYATRALLQARAAGASSEGAPTAAASSMAAASAIVSETSPAGLVLWSSEPLRQRSARSDARAAERGPVAAGVGQMGALCAIALLTGKPPAAQLPARPARGLLRRLAARLAARERDVFGADPQETSRLLPPDALELACVAGWAMRCALTAEPYDSRASNLALTRRDRARPPSVGNVLLLREDLARKHDEAERPADAWAGADRRRIERVCAVLAHADGADDDYDEQAIK